MRVAIAFPGCHRKGGVERVMLECVNYLAREKHDVHAYAEEFEEAALGRAVCQYRVHRPKLPDFARIPAFVRASRLAIGQLDPKPDVLTGFGAAAPLGGVVWMQSVHAAWIAESQVRRSFGGRLKQRLNPFHPVILRMERKLLQRRLYRKVIALSEAVKSDIQDFYQVPDEDITVIPNGFSAAEFNRPETDRRREEIRQRLGFTDQERVVIFVANELERKGFFPLVRSIAQLNDQSIRLLAVGRLNEGACATEIRKLGMSKQVVFTGPTSRVAEYFSAADIFALPTHYEAWGLVVVEAMACGLPVLTSRAAGASIAVQEGRNGALLESPADEDEIASKLKNLLEGRHESPGWIAESVLKYEWAEILPKYETVLRECVVA